MAEQDKDKIVLPGINLSLVAAPRAGLVRLSFAYLYEVVLDDQYLLVFNDNAESPKYQPLGGAYQCPDETLTYLKANYHLQSGKRRDDFEAPGAHDYRFLLPLAEVKPFLYDFLLGDLAPIEEEDPLARQKSWQDMESYGVCAPDYLFDAPIYGALRQLIECGIKHRVWTDRLMALNKIWSWPRATDLQAFGVKGPARTWEELDALGQREYILDTRRELCEEIAATQLFTLSEQKHFSWVDYEYLGRSYSVAFDYGFNCPSLMLTDCVRLSVSPKLYDLFHLALERQDDQSYHSATGFKPFRLFTREEIEAAIVARTQQSSFNPNEPSCADHCRFILPDAGLHMPEALEGV